jgi:integrase
MHHDSDKHLDNFALFEKSPPGPYVLTHYRLDELTPTVLDDWLAQRLKPKLRKKGLRAASKATARRNLGALKAVLVQAVKWGVIPASPLQHYAPIKQVDNARTRYLAPEEEHRLLAALEEQDAEQRKKLKEEVAWVKKRYKDNPAKLRKRMHGPKMHGPWLKSLVLLALNTGARQGQLRKLEWRDVDFERRLLTLRPETAKTKKINHVPLNAQAIEALRLMPVGDPTDAVFPGRRGKFLNNPNGPWRKLLKAADISDFSFHCLRHSFASSLVNEGVDLYRVQRLLTHSTASLTQRYAHLDPDYMRDAVDRLDKRRKGVRS